MAAIAQKIDSDLAGLYIDVPYVSGTAGTTPSALADVAGIGKVMNINKVPFTNRNLVIDPREAHAKLVVIDSIARADASGSTEVLRNASIGRVLGFDSYMDQNIKTHTAGGYTALADVTITTGAAGATSIVLTSAAGASTAKLLKGDVLAIDGSTYVVTEDTDAAVAGVVTAKIFPALPASKVGKAATFKASHVANIGFHKNAFALVNRPMMLPVGGASGYIANYNGLSIRVTQGYTMSSKVNTISFDILYGVKTLDPTLAARLLG